MLHANIQEDTFSSIPTRENKMAMMAVRKIEVATIKPSRETPNHVLYLSEEDNLCNYSVPLIRVYEGSNKEESNNPAKVLREALGRVLVYYYPLAGVLKKANHVQGPGKFEVDCNAQGVLFVEAEADCMLEDVGYFLKTPLPWDSPLLLHSDPDLPREQIPFLTLQVTRFKCGGFVLGITFSHTIMDGYGFFLFMKALVEMVNNGEKEIAPSVIPAWERELLKPNNDTVVPFPLQPIRELTTSVEECCRATFSFPSEVIDHVKKEVVEESKGSLDYCTTFEALTSLIWQTCLKSWALVETKDEQIACEEFCYAMSVKKILNPPVSEGYYGNCFVMCVVGKNDFEAEDVNNLSKADVVKAMRKAKGRITNEYVRSYMDFCYAARMKDETGNLSMILPNKMIFNDWGKFSYGEDLNCLGKAACTLYPEIPLLGRTQPGALFLPPGSMTPTGLAVLILHRKIMHFFRSFMEISNVACIF